MKKIKFRELSGWIQIAIIGGWITMISFLVGFVQGLLFY